MATDRRAAAQIEPIESVGQGINRLQRLLASRRVFFRLAASAGLSLSQQSTQVLLALRVDPLSITDVASSANMDAGAVSRHLKILERAGLATRAPSPEHGRIVLVRCSAKGNRVADRVRSVRRRHLDDALAGWTTDEKRRLGDLLNRLVVDLQSTPYHDTSR